MSTRRQSFEPGHRRKLLVILDDTEECRCALEFAGRRASRTGGVLVMLYVIPPPRNAMGGWLRIDERLRSEATREAKVKVAGFRRSIRERIGIEPEVVIREGDRAEQILELVDLDPDIAILILAAATTREGPGPLISQLVSRTNGTLQIPITVVPGSLSDEEIGRLA